MELTARILAIIAIVAVTGSIWTLTVSESANAWHSMFESKKACVNWFKALGNTTSEGEFACEKVVPHQPTNSTTNSTPNSTTNST
jgi:hypothetical protein